MTDEEIIQLAKETYQDDDVRIETNPGFAAMVDRTEDGTGAWVQAMVWVPFPSRIGQLNCLRMWDGQYGWVCASPDGPTCLHYEPGATCGFDGAAEQEWRAKARGG